MFKNIIIILIAILTYSYSCAAGLYVGADIGAKTLRFQPGYGDNLFVEVLSFGNISIGFRFNNYFGIESGYHSTINDHRTAILFRGEKNLGLTLLVDSAKYISKSKLYGSYVNLVGTYPISSLGIDSSIALIYCIGIQKTTTRLSRTRIELNSQPSFDFIQLNRNYKKNIVKFSFGAQNSINKHCSIITTIFWENTAKIKPFSINESANGPSITTAKLKNTLGYSVGIVLK